LNIGDYALGGVVFWLDGNGGGLICDVSNLPSSTWYAATSNCQNSTAQGYTDWYLPSKVELAQMYANKTAINTAATANGGSSFSSSYYWSSTEYLGTYARRYSFYSGSLDWAIRYQTHRVRAVRAF